MVRRFLFGLVGAALVLWSLPVQAAGTFTGTVTKTDGTTPVAGVFVGVMTADFTQHLGGAQTNASGAFSIAAPTATPGAYKIIVDLPSDPAQAAGLMRPNPVDVTLASDGTTVSAGVIRYGQASKTITGTVTKSGVALAGAQVNAFQQGGGFAQTTTVTNGTYSLAVSGGNWEVFPEQNRDPQFTGDKNWSYDLPPTRVEFAQDTTTQSQTVNFAVTVTNALVKGKVVRDDGAALVGYQFLGVMIGSSEGAGRFVNTNPDGTFQASVRDGTYDARIEYRPISPEEEQNQSLAAAVSEAKTYSGPDLAPVTVGAGETKDLGTIKLVKKTSHIKGKVTDSSGTALAGKMVAAFSPTGGGFSMGRTAADGTYDLLVPTGSWMVMAAPPGGMGPGGQQEQGPSYVSNDAPKRVDLSANQTVGNINFKLTLANATIAGKVVDESNNQVVTSLYGWAGVKGELGKGMTGLGGSVQGGSFSISVPAGTYNLFLGVPPGNEYNPVATVSVTVAANQTVQAILKVKKANATITGKLLDSAGNQITTVDGDVFLENSSTGAFQMAQLKSGSYTVKVVDGTWRVGYHLRNTSDFLPQFSKETVTVSNGGTATFNLTTRKADVTITGTVKKPDGSAAVGAHVFADNRTGAVGLAQGGDPFFNGGVTTDKDGKYTLKVPAGTFFVGASYPPEVGFINPPAQSITAASGSSQTVNLQFRSTDATITGTVTLDGQGIKAFLFAASSKGASAQVAAGSDGKYTLPVIKGETWYLKAVSEQGNTFYLARARTDVNETATTVDLALKKIADGLEGTTVSFDAATTQEISLPNGTKVNIPGGALASSGQVTVSAVPTALLPESTVRTLVGYDFVATNSQSQTITKFNSNVTITIPYTDSDLTELGVTDPVQLVPMFFSTTSGTYEAVNAVVVDSTKKTVSFQTDHFTQFALTTSTDATAPANVTEATATAGDGKVTLAWKNPTDSDFDHVNVYRSTTDGQLGSKIGQSSSKTATSYDDTGLTNGTKYFYTLKAADTTGNEASGTSQLSATPNVLPKTGGSSDTFTYVLAALAMAAAVVFTWTHVDHRLHR